MFLDSAMLYKYVKTEITRPVQAPAAEDLFKKRSNIKTSIFTFISFSLGVSLLIFSFFPYLSQYYEKITGSKETAKSILSPSQTETLANAAVNQNNEAFSSNYISNVNKNFSLTNQLLNINERTFPEYAHIKGTMYLSIPSLNLTDLPVVINVNSFEEKEYMPYLENNLAHFQGTSLPDKDGNTFIYGHSANILLAQSDPKNPKYAFSFLDKLEIGDEIIVKYNNKKYVYSMKSSRFVAPEDISPIYSTSDDKILTLMSCYAPGVGNQRIIIKSKLIEEIDL